MVYRPPWQKIARTPMGLTMINYRDTLTDFRTEAKTVFSAA